VICAAFRGIATLMGSATRCSPRIEKAPNLQADQFLPGGPHPPNYREKAIAARVRAAAQARPENLISGGLRRAVAKRLSVAQVECGMGKNSKEGRNCTSDGARPVHHRTVRLSPL
jgi:hypothetical protein